MPPACISRQDGENMMTELNGMQWAVMALSAVLIGLTKTGVPGVGILAIPLLAYILPAKQSTGFVLPMLIMADLFAVAYYRRQAVWPHVARLAPWAVAGIVLGWLIMGRISDRQLQPFIGITILTLMGLTAWRRSGAKDGDAVPAQWWFAAGLGLMAGMTTMLANAAGPIMVIYLVAMRLPKEEFIGTGAWYFFLLNCFKIPFSANLGLITLESLKVNLMMLPAITAGALSGIFLLRRIPQRWFTITVEILAVLAAVKLLLS